MNYLKNLHKNKSLILLPHYDDEIFIFPLLRKLNNCGIETHLLWLTQSGGINKELDLKLIQKRKFESENLLKKTGLTNLNTHHLGLLFEIPDGKLFLEIEKVEKSIRSKFAPGLWTLITPHWENGHSDHDVTFLLGKILEKEGFGEHYSFPMYNTKSKFKPFQVMNFEAKETKIPMRIGKKDRLTFILVPLYFKSQLKAWIGLYLPIILKTLFRKQIYFFEGKTMSSIYFNNMRLIEKRSKNDTTLYVNRVIKYCVKNNIPINVSRHL